MVKLATYEPSVQPADFYPNRLPRDVAHPAAGGVGSALSGIGGDLLALSHRNDMLAREQQRIEDEQALAQAHVNFAGFQEQQFKALNDAQQAAPADPSTVENNGVKGFTPNFMQNYDVARQKIVGDTVNPKAQQWLSVATANYGSHLYDRSVLWEAKQRAQFNLEAVKQLAASKSAVVAGDETLYPQLTAELKDYANANLPADLRPHALDPALLAMRASAFDGWAARNPRAAQAAVNDLLGIAPKPAPAPSTTPAPQPSGAPPGLYARVIGAESGGVHRVGGELLTSPAGAQGISQVMPATGADPGYGVLPLQNASKAEYLRFGSDYLGAMLREFGGDQRKAVAAYNAGPGAVQKAIAAYGDDYLAHLPAETQAYVRTVFAPPASPTQLAQNIATSITDVDSPLLAPADAKMVVTGKRVPAFLADMSGHELIAAKARADHLVGHDQAEAQRELRSWLHNAGAQAEHGVAPMTVDADLVQRAVGPERAPQVLSDVADLQRFGAAMGKVQTMTAPEMDAGYTALAPTSKDDPAWAARQRDADLFKAAAGRAIAARQQDGIAAARDQGIASVPALTWGDDKQLRSDMTARQAVAIRMATQYGAPNFSIFDRSEAKVYSEGWDRLTTSDQVAALRALHQALPDPRVYRDSVSHFVGGSPAIQFAASLADRSPAYRAPDGTAALDVAYGVLDGERLLHPTKQAQREGEARSAYKLPPTGGASGMDDYIAKRIGDAFLENADSYERAKQVIYAYYAHLANRDGAPSETAYNTGRLDRAIDTVVGERSRWATLFGMGGQRVLRPWGMPDDEFAARISNAYSDAMARSGYAGTPVDDKRRIELVRVGESQYGLRMGEKRLTWPGTNRSIVLDIANPEVQP